MDNIKRNIKEFTEELRQCIDLRLDSAKLMATEELSKIIGTLLTSLAVALPLFFAFLFLLVAIVILLIPFVGVVWSLFIVTAFLILLSIVLYLWCRPIFTRIMLVMFCRMFFKKDSDNEE